MKHLPNALTLLRLVLAPVVAWFFAMGALSYSYAPHTIGDVPGEFALAWDNWESDVAFYFNGAVIIFVIAALTDLFDGMAARAFNAQTKFGRLIDPIADKALVGLPLLAIAVFNTHAYAMLPPIVPLWWPSVLAILVIVGRDVIMTVIRLKAPDGEGAPVSQLAKVKTALELVLIASFLAFCAFHAQIDLPGSDEAGQQGLLMLRAGFVIAWQVALVITAALSAWTAWQYLRPAKTIP